ncbi:hypothetical protein MMC21_006523 [Puttea exsequens]|nr:hypothetical protein [Puttea exsequens]
MSTPLKAKPFILTVSTACIAVAGAWYGASLKEEAQRKEGGKQDIEASVKPAEVMVAQRIAILEQTRRKLMTQKGLLEDKIQRLEARQADGKGQE